ncbi:GrpB family protein [Clostridium sp. D33t1_170424_F3]|uniref:GrpB family protein n=1 Tax=Clostridium sp. D33t1_170424_F3 TaxID=2787099 RepID=UPI0018A93C6A|nr:GrpB family protein [Clostridium sp. D33t1_170424_F3]
MKKDLSKMSLRELWELFPIFLTEHQAIWRDWYDAEAQRLQTLLPKETVIRISHIGSTAVHGIRAKPIIDILIEITNDCKMERLSPILREAGYLSMHAENTRASFNRGYTPNGFAEKVFHLHLRYKGDHDELYFRDYLNDRPDTAKAYETLKLHLWMQYEHDRDAYTAGKTEFVTTCTKLAKAFYGDRYN